jgi:hypothetical protein
LGIGNFFGYKFASVTSFDGLPIMYELVAANIDERDAAGDVFDYLRHCAMFGGKGLIGADWQAEVKERISNRIWTTKRVNQKGQNSPWFDRLLNSVCERIEGSFNL